MKNNYSPVLLLGVAGGLICWSLYEFFLFIITPLMISSLIQLIFSGGFAGLLTGCFIGGQQGYFKHSFKQLKKNALLGGIAGLIAGVVFSYVSHYASSNLLLSYEGKSFIDHIYITRWLFLAIFIGGAMGFYESVNVEITRSVLSGFITGLLCIAILYLAHEAAVNSFIERGIAFISFCTLFSYFLSYFSTFKRKEWIKSLNGQLTGFEFELSKASHYFGTQVCDDINLKSYEKVNPAHAKLIKYYTGYSLTDNDPFGQTYVNFRSIKEQPLKNGDILKIGTALFQYCRNDI